MFSGSKFPVGLMGILCDQTESGKIQDGGLQTPNTYISASRLDINEIPTATPVFSGSSFPMGLMGILCDQAKSENNPKLRSFGSKYVLGPQNDLYLATLPPPGKSK